MDASPETIAAPHDDLETLLDTGQPLSQVESARRICQQAIETVADHISVVGRDYRYRHVNAAYLRDLDLPEHQIVGHDVADLLGQDLFRDIVKPRLDRCLQGEEVSYEAWFSFRACGRKFMHVIYSPLRTGPNQVGGVVVVARDITPRRETEEQLRSENLELERRVRERTRELEAVNAALRLREERFRVFYEDNPSMYFVVDDTGRIRSSNRYGAEHLGYRPEELVDRHVSILFHEQDREPASQALTRAFARPDVTHQWSFRKRTKGGQILWVQETVRPVREPDGGPVALIVCQDITAQVRSEALIREQEHAIRALQEATSAPGVSFEDRIQTVLELGCRRFGLPIGIFTRISGEYLDIAQVWPSTASVQPGTRLPLCHSYCGATVQADGPVSIEHAGASEWAAHPAYTAMGFESYVGIKLAGQSRTYGIICFVGHEPSPGGFSESQMDFLTLMSHWISDELDRQDSEQALLESRELFALAFQASPHPMIITELASGRCLEVNDVSLHLFGFRREEVIGRTTIALNIWPTLRDREQFLERLHREGGLRDVELAFRTKHGRWVQCRVSCEPITLSGVRCLLTVGLDITERQQAEAALRASEERFRRLFEEAPLGMCIVGSDRTIRKANPAFLELTGYGEADIVGRTSDFYTHPEDLPRNLELTRQFLSGTIPGYTQEKRYIRKNGALIWVSATFSPLAFPAVEEKLSVCIVQDTTARKLAEQALEHRERDLRQALEEREQVSQDLHDGILQSLYAIGLSLDTTGRLVGTAPRRARQELTGAISQLNRTIQEIRSFITGLSFDLLDAAQFTQALQTVVAAFCKPGRVCCDIAVSPGAIRRLARPNCVHLINIVREAVSNSVRHGKATRVWVTLRSVKGRVQLAVRDNGHGFKTGTAIKRGYGLRNMRSRAQKVGGSLRISSTPNIGTRIMVSFTAEEPRD